MTLSPSSREKRQIWYKMGPNQLQIINPTSGVFILTYNWIRGPSCIFPDKERSNFWIPKSFLTTFYVFFLNLKNPPKKRVLEPFWMGFSCNNIRTSRKVTNGMDYSGLDFGCITPPRGRYLDSLMWHINVCINVYIYDVYLHIYIFMYICIYVYIHINIWNPRQDVGYFGNPPQIFGKFSSSVVTKTYIELVPKEFTLKS